MGHSHGRGGSFSHPAAAAPAAWRSSPLSAALVAGRQDRPRAAGFLIFTQPAPLLLAYSRMPWSGSLLVQLSDAAGHFQACDQLSIAGVPAHP
jgi:hypothetical protein